MPAPGAYKYAEYIGKVNAAKAKSGSKEEKFNSFIEHAKWKAQQVPGPSKRNDKMHSMIEPRSRPAIFFKEDPNGKDDRFKKIVIDKKAVAPGDYNVIEAYKATQTRSLKMYTAKAKKDSFIDPLVKAKAKIVGPGHYFKGTKDNKKDEMAVFKHISPGPP